MRKVLAIIILLVFSIVSFGQTAGLDLIDYGVEIQPDKRLITIMTSLEAANVETPLSKSGEEFRAHIRKDLQSVSPELKNKIRIFFDGFKKRHPQASTEEALSPFISLAYSLSPAPELSAPERSLDLPDDLLEVLDYSDLAKEFYSSPGMAAKIDEYYKKYLSTSAGLKPQAVEMVRDVSNYLYTKPLLVYVERIPVESDDKNKKNYKISESPRTFTIIPEMLAPKDTVNFLNIGDKYVAIVSPETNIASSEVRRAFIQFVVDPFVLKNAGEITKHGSEIKKLLDERRKAGTSVSPDVFLALSRSLVAAIDAREAEFTKGEIATARARQKIDSLTDKAEQKAVADELARFKSALADDAALELSESYKKGAVLAFYFAEKLKGMEGSGIDISTFLTDWIVSMTPVSESLRLEEYAEASSRAAEKRNAGTRVETTLITNPVTQELLRIDKIIEQKKYSQAQTELKSLLKKHPEESARIYYSLGRVSSLSAEGIEDPEEINKHLLEAKVFYENVLRSAAPADDAGLVSSTYFALGRIYEYYSQNAYAIQIYDAAIKLGRVEGGAHDKAVNAKQKLLEKIQDQ